MTSDLTTALLVIRRVSGDKKWGQFPAAIKQPMADIYSQAGLALDCIKSAKTVPTRPKQLVVIEGSPDRERTEEYVRIKLQSCGIDAEVLVLVGDQRFSLIEGGDGSTAESGPAPEASPAAADPA